MRWHLMLIMLLCTGVVSAYVVNYTPDQYDNRQYHFAVNITKSLSHKPSYTTVFNRQGNFTINYTKVPKVLQGVKPAIPHTNEINLDVIKQKEKIYLDPRTCANDLAYCYQVVEHNQTRTTFGKNYSALSSYLLPGTRVKTYVCVGNDTSCTSTATNCFCPRDKINPPPLVHEGNCDDTTHLCLDTYGSFKLCTGNLTSCKEQYSSCGCGKKAGCVAAKQTCVNDRNQLVLCSENIAECLTKYSTCFCGPEVLAFQNSCKTDTHTCHKGESIVTCIGSFNACALQFDKCEC